MGGAAAHELTKSTASARFGKAGAALVVFKYSFMATSAVDDHVTEQTGDRLGLERLIASTPNHFTIGANIFLRYIDGGEFTADDVTEAYDAALSTLHKKHERRLQQLLQAGADAHEQFRATEEYQQRREFLERRRAALLQRVEADKERNRNR